MNTTYTIKRTLKGNLFNRFIPNRVKYFIGNFTDLAYRLAVTVDDKLYDAKNIDEFMSILGDDFELFSRST